MIRRLVGIAALSVAATSAVHAQGKSQPDAACTSTSTDPTNQRRLLQDACQKAVDIFNYMAPQLGTAIAGGNATLGQGSTLGGLGHFSFGLRATAVVKGSFPLLDETSRPDTGAAKQSTLRTEEYPVPAPAVDLAIGLFKGVPLGVTNVGGIDLLVSAAFIPEFGDPGKGDDFTVKAPDGSLKLGYGARLGILQEGAVVPGLAVTYLVRGLPKLDITGTIRDPNPALSDSVYVRQLDMTASSWRIVASKKLLFLGIAAGYGMDKYDASAEIGAVVNEACPVILVCRASTGDQPLATFDQQVTRSNLFANLSLNLFMFKLAGEVGQVSGGDITTFNRFVDEKNQAEPPDQSRLYASVGLRVGF